MYIHKKCIQLKQYRLFNYFMKNKIKLIPIGVVVSRLYKKLAQYLLNNFFFQRKINFLVVVDIHSHSLGHFKTPSAASIVFFFF